MAGSNESCLALGECVNVVGLRAAGLPELLDVQSATLLTAAHPESAFPLSAAAAPLLCVGKAACSRILAALAHTRLHAVCENVSVY